MSAGELLIVEDKNKETRYEIGEGTREYIIDGLLFVPHEDMELCRYESVIDTATVTVYATGGGNFYEVREGITETEVKRLSCEDALQFAHDHPAGTDNEVYTKVFGTPKRG